MKAFLCPRRMLILPAPLLILAAACAPHSASIGDAQIRQYEMRNLASRGGADVQATVSPEQLARLAQTDPPQPVQIRGPVVPARPPASAPAPFDVSLELPDPIHVEEVFRRRMDVLTDNVRREYEDREHEGVVTRGIYPIALDYIRESRRGRQVPLSLNDCLIRSLRNNYQIRVDGYGPAISAAQIVQSEAAFDAAFFANISRDNRDQPVAVQLQAGTSLSNVYSAGVRQRLITGADVSLTQSLARQDVPNFRFQTLNPAYSTSFIIEFRQPLLRNFGVDFNRSQIDIARNQRDITIETFRRTVITTLNEVERAYWQLVASRREVVIAAELLAQAERTLAQVEARSDYDAFATLVANSRATVASRRAIMIASRRNMYNAQDALLNLLNDPDYHLAQDLELIPSDLPVSEGVVRDSFREVEIALERRPEIREAKLAVENARIQLGIAKNQAMPSLDLVLRHTINGLGGNADKAFDEMTAYDFADTLVSLEFVWFFGERAERAGIRIAALRNSQAIASFKRVLDDVITDCRVALRNLDTSLEQIPSSKEAVTAAKENLRSIQERAESKSPEQLNTIFNAQLQVANTRQALLQQVVSYNQSIVDVERAKGTLLEYNNVRLVEQP